MLTRKILSTELRVQYFRTADKNQLYSPLTENTLITIEEFSYCNEFMLNVNDIILSVRFINDLTPPHKQYLFKVYSQHHSN